MGFKWGVFRAKLNWKTKPKPPVAAQCLSYRVFTDEPVFLVPSHQENGNISTREKSVQNGVIPEEELIIKPTDVVKKKKAPSKPVVQSLFQSNSTNNLNDEPQSSNNTKDAAQVKGILKSKSTPNLNEETDRKVSSQSENKSPLIFMTQKSEDLPEINYKTRPISVDSYKSEEDDYEILTTQKSDTIKDNESDDGRDAFYQKDQSFSKSMFDKTSEEKVEEQEEEVEDDNDEIEEAEEERDVNEYETHNYYGSNHYSSQAASIFFDDSEPDPVMRKRNIKFDEDNDDGSVGSEASA